MAEAVIGLEVHAQLRTGRKLFCACRAAPDAPPNSLVCPVCLGLPGALPVLDGAAAALALRAAVALGASVARRSEFARKSYFYPDLPKGYQITQYARPLAVGGALEFNARGARRRVDIVRLHLEEDAGKLLHRLDRVLIDHNRAGTALLEIVTAPQLRTAEEAQLCLKRLRQLLRYLDVCDGNLEEGSLRCDANISLPARPGAPPGARVEIKNLNSFAAVRRALEHEARRLQIARDAGRPAAPQTRGWDADAGRTHFLRAKEAADDYRYFPEPDLPPLRLEPAEIAAAACGLPELPAAREERLAREHGLTAAAAALLAEERELADFFEETAFLAGDGKAAARWISGEVRRELNARGGRLSALPVTAAELAALIGMQRRGAVSGRAAKEVFAGMVATGETAAAAVARLGLARQSDPTVLGAALAAALAAHPGEAAACRAGRRALVDFFVGEVIRLTAGRADPALARRLVEEELASPGGGG